MILAQILNGISWGAILFLLSSGLCLMFGLMRVVNMAHGSFYMIAGYISWSVGAKAGFTLGLLAAVLCIAVIGLVSYLGLLRSLHKQDLKQLLLTFGMIYIFSDLSQWIWSGQLAFPPKPALLAKSAQFWGITYPLYQLALILIGVGIGIVLWIIQDKTKLGAIVRAGVDDEQMVRGLGINLFPIFTGIFTLGAALAGFGGGMGAVFTGSYLGVDSEILILSLVVIVIGGLGSLQGAMLGSLLIGLADTFGKAYLPEFASFTIFSIMALVLILKPSGLLGRPEA
jgi:branched-chain amino acid transport system permease protein